MSDNTTTKILTLGFDNDLIEVAAPISKTLTNHNTIQIGLDATNIQSKLAAAGDGVNSFPLLSSDTVKGFRADFPFTMNDNTTTKILTLGFDNDIIEVAAPISKTITNNNTIQIGLDASNTQSKLTAAGDSVNSFFYY